MSFSDLDEDNEQHENTFFWEGNDKYPVTSSGTLLFKLKNDVIYLLINNVKGTYGDIGGNVKECDNTIYDTAAREMNNKTNGMITTENIIARLHKAKSIYIPQLKYILFLLPATLYEEQLKKNNFGDVETYGNVKRTIGWIKCSDMFSTRSIKYMIILRLKYKYKTIVSELKKMKYVNIFR